MFPFDSFSLISFDCTIMREWHVTRSRSPEQKSLKNFNLRISGPTIDRYIVVMKSVKGVTMDQNMFLSQKYYNNTNQLLVQNVLFVRIHYAMKIDKYKQKLNRNNKETKSSKNSNKTTQFIVDVLFFKYVVKLNLKVYNLLGWCELKKI